MARPELTVAVAGDEPAALPDRFGDVPVRRHAPPDRGFDGSTCVESGARIRPEVDEDAGFTAAAPVSVDGTVLMLTCAHALLAECDDDCDIFLDDVVHEASGAAFAQVVDWDCHRDWALLAVLPDGPAEGLHPRLHRAETITGAPIRGHVTEDGLATLAASDETIYKYGRTEHVSKGRITGDGWAHSSEGPCGEAQWIETTAERATGDSGGPHYRRVETGDGDVVRRLVGVHSGYTGGGWNGATQSRATPAHVVREATGAVVGAASC